MPQKLLKLLNRHSLVDCHRCKSTPELVRMYFLKSQPFSKFTQANLNAADFQSFVRWFQRDEEGGMIVRSTLQVPLQMNLCSSVKINYSFFTAFTEHDTFSLVEINIISVQQHHFADTHTCGSQHVDHWQVSRFRAVIPHQLQCFIGISFLDVRAGFYSVYASDRAFQYVILVLQPREEAGQDTADIVYRNLAWFLLFLILGQVSSNIVRYNVLNIFVQLIEHCFNGCLVVFKRFLGTALNSLCR